MTVVDTLTTPTDYAQNARVLTAALLAPIAAELDVLAGDAAAEDDPAARLAVEGYTAALVDARTALFEVVDAAAAHLDRNGRAL